MANETNKVPCGGFKVGGGLSVNDGMLKMGCIVGATVLNKSQSATLGLMIPYKSIQFDNPLFTQTIKKTGQIITMDLYDMFVGVEYSFYKAIIDDNKEIKQVLPNDNAEPEIASFVVAQEFNDSKAIKAVTIRSFMGDQTQETYTVTEIIIPDEIEEVLHFGGRGWFLANPVG